MIAVALSAEQWATVCAALIVCNAGDLADDVRTQVYASFEIGVE